jgi:hypothetical protein
MNSMFADPEEAVAVADYEHSVECPSCGAAVGDPCLERRGKRRGEPMRAIHPDRQPSMSRTEHALLYPVWAMSRYRIEEAHPPELSDEAVRRVVSIILTARRARSHQVDGTEETP